MPLPKDNKHWLWLGLGAVGVAAVIAYLFKQGKPSSSDSSALTAKRSARTASVNVSDTVHEPTTPTPDQSSPANQSLNQADPKYWTDKAKVAIAASDWKSAVKFWSEAIDRKADFKYYTNRCVALLNLSRFVDAEKDARESIKLAENEPNLNAQQNLAKALHAQGGVKLEEAKKVVEHVIRQSRDTKLTNLANALKKKIDQSISQSTEQVASQTKRASVSKPAGSTVTINLDGPSSQSASQSTTQLVDQSIDDIPPPAFRRQDTEEDLANMDQSAPVPHSSHHQSIEDHDHVFPVNQPPISFAEIVKHEPVDHSHDEPAKPDVSAPATTVNPSVNQSASAPSVPAVVTPVPAPVLPHGSFASVVAHAEDVAHEQENHSLSQSANLSDSLELVAASEADEAMRHRDLARAETTLLTRQAQQQASKSSESVDQSLNQSSNQSIEQSISQSFSSSTSANSLPISEVHDDLTSSGVLVNESDVNEAMQQEEQGKSATKPLVPQTVLPLAGTWNKLSNNQTSNQSINQSSSQSSNQSLNQSGNHSNNQSTSTSTSVESTQPITQPSVEPHTSTPSSTQPISQSVSQSSTQPMKPVQSITTPSTPKRNQRSQAGSSSKPQSMDASPVQKKKQPQSAKKINQSISQSVIQSHSATNSPVLSSSAVRSPPAGPMPVEVQAPATQGGKSWASLVKK